MVTRKISASANTGLLLCYWSLCWLSDDVLSGRIVTCKRKSPRYCLGLFRFGLIILTRTLGGFCKVNYYCIWIWGDTRRGAFPAQIKIFSKMSWQEVWKCSIINAIGVLCLNPYTSKRRRKTWKEHISPRSCTEKKNTALWRECPQETVARFLQEDVQRAEQGFPTKNKRQAARAAGAAGKVPPLASCLWISCSLRPHRGRSQWGLPFCGLFI